MKIKAVVFKMHQQIVPGEEEDDPRRWFRDRLILLVQMQSSLPPEVLEMDEVLAENYELLRLAEIQMFVPVGILVVSDDQKFLRWAEEQRFHTATLHDIDNVIGRILTIEYQK